MRKRMAAWVLLAGLAGLPSAAQAATTGSITVTVALASEIAVAITPGTWAIGPVTLSSTHGSTSFTAAVGNTATQLEIMGADGAGGWTIGNTPGLNRFAVAVPSPALTLTKAYQLLAASVPAYGSASFTLIYSAPTQDNIGGGVSQNTMVTLRASAAP